MLVFEGKSTMFYLVSFLVFAFLVAAEDGLNAWLRYAPLTGTNSSQYSLPSSIVVLNSTDTSPVYTAGTELQKGFQGIFGKTVSIQNGASNTTSTSVIAGTLEQYIKSYGNSSGLPVLEGDGFWLSTVENTVQILGQNDRGALYGAFEYLSMLAQGNFSKVAYASNPSAPIRWTNEWNNLDGSIERGYGGPSIFFQNGVIVANLTRASLYARLLASVGINGK